MKKDDISRFIEAAQSISKRLDQLAQIQPLSSKSTYTQTADTTRKVLSIYANVSSDIIRFLVFADRILETIDFEDRHTREIFLAQLENCRADAQKLTDLSCAVEDLILELCQHINNRVQKKND